MDKIRLATLWLDGCSGCHMSLLDLDERILSLAEHVDFVYGPLVDRKEFPEAVDVTLVEGAVGYDEDVEKLRLIRARTKVLVALGDCAVSGNVPAMRNALSAIGILEATYLDAPSAEAQIPRESLPALLPRVRPIHEVVDVDVYVQGCPPSADAIWYVLSELLAGRTPRPSLRTRPGA